MGLYCPDCWHLESTVIESRSEAGGEKVYRRRQCSKCGCRYETCEVLVSEAGPNPVQTIIELRRRDGLTLKEIGQRVGMTYQGVAYHLRKAGIETSRQHASDETLTDKIEALYEQGHSIREVGELVNLAPSAVYRRLQLTEVDTTKKLKPIGCETCRTTPYARGMCVNCYRRWLRRRKAQQAG